MLELRRLTFTYVCRVEETTIINRSHLVKRRKDDGMRGILWEVDVQRGGILGVRVGADSSYWVQHLFKFIWEHQSRALAAPLNSS